MVGTNASKNEKHKLYNSTVQALRRGGGGCYTKVVALCARLVYLGAPVKIQVENVLSKLFNFRGQTIDMSDQAVFTLKYLGLFGEEVNKTNVSDPLTVGQR